MWALFICVVHVVVQWVVCGGICAVIFYIIRHGYVHINFIIIPPTLLFKLTKQYQHNASQDTYIDAKYINNIQKNMSTHTLTHLHPTANMTTHKAK